MKIVEYEFEVDAPWELALLAYDRKSWAVPSPEYKEILRCDFDEWEVDLDLELTKFRRSVQVSMPLPQWIMRFLSDDTDFWYEFRTIMDRKNRRLDVKGHNASLQSLLSTTEHMVMKEHPENPNKCVLTYHTTWDIHSKSWVVPKFETFISRLYYKALKRGRQLDKRYIDQYRKTYEEQEIPLTRSERNGRDIVRAQQAAPADTLDSARWLDSGLSSEMTAGRSNQSMLNTVVGNEMYTPEGRVNVDWLCQSEAPSATPV